MSQNVCLSALTITDCCAVHIRRSVITISVLVLVRAWKFHVLLRVSKISENKWFIERNYNIELCISIHLSLRVSLRKKKIIPRNYSKVSGFESLKTILLKLKLSFKSVTSNSIFLVNRYQVTRFLFISVTILVVFYATYVRQRTSKTQRWTCYSAYAITVIW